MVKYIVILLDDKSISFCHYDNSRQESRLMPLDVLRKGVFYAMTENLLVQFVYPEYRLPQEYEDLIESVNHVKIVPVNSPYSGDVIVSDWECLDNIVATSATYVLRTSLDGFLADYSRMLPLLSKAQRINVLITDLAFQTDERLRVYYETLVSLSEYLCERYDENRSVQLNVITDRMMLTSMNNCNAGWEHVTLAPDGRFFVCPAFYHDGLYSIGSLEEGLNIKNPQLYRLDYAPLCRNCDAYQCKRCIWLNLKKTLEVNTPSHEQCVSAHHERNASRYYMNLLQQGGFTLQCRDMKEIDYLDPFDVRNNL